MPDVLKTNRRGGSRMMGLQTEEPLGEVLSIQAARRAIVSADLASSRQLQEKVASDKRIRAFLMQLNCAGYGIVKLPNTGQAVLPLETEQHQKAHP